MTNTQKVIRLMNHVPPHRLHKDLRVRDGQVYYAWDDKERLMSEEELLWRLSDLEYEYAEQAYRVKVYSEKQALVAALYYTGGTAQ